MADKYARARLDHRGHPRIGDIPQRYARALGSNGGVSSRLFVSAHIIRKRLLGRKREGVGEVKLQRTG